MMDTNLIRVAMQRRKERDLVTIEEEHKHFWATRLTRSIDRTIFTTIIRWDTEVMMTAQEITTIESKKLNYIKCLDEYIYLNETQQFYTYSWL
jgi:hypothetical protein